MRLFSALFSAAVLFAACSPKPTALTVTQPYVYATAEAGVTAVGYLVINNPLEKDDRLLSARSPDIQSIEIHEMSMADGMMRMRAYPDGLQLPAKSQVELKSGGVHLMLFGSTHALKVGDSLPIDLIFEQAGLLPTTFKIVERK